MQMFQKHPYQLEMFSSKNWRNIIWHNTQSYYHALQRPPVSTLCWRKPSESSLSGHTHIQIQSTEYVFCWSTLLTGIHWLFCKMCFMVPAPAWLPCLFHSHAESFWRKLWRKQSISFVCRPKLLGSPGKQSGKATGFDLKFHFQCRTRNSLPEGGQHFISTQGLGRRDFCF